MELFELRLHLLCCWLINDLEVVVTGLHANEWFDLASVQQNCLVYSKSANYHASYRIENAALPVLVVGEHLRELTAMGLERVLLDHSQICITNRVVVLHELVKFLESSLIEPVHKILSLLKLVRSEVNLSDNLRIFNCLNLLFDIGGVAEHTIFHLLELVDSLLALADVLHDRKREPVVVSGSLLHLEVQLTKHCQK